MVNSRQKGKKGEAYVKRFLEEHTPYTFEYTPGSGSGKIKGDLYIPRFENTFVIEIKNYKESPISDKILTNKSNDFVKWWDKVWSDCYDGVNWGKKPLIFFRYNYSKLFVATSKEPERVNKRLDIPGMTCYIMLAEDWITKEKIEWLIM